MQGEDTKILCNNFDSCSNTGGDGGELLFKLEKLAEKILVLGLDFIENLSKVPKSRQKGLGLTQLATHPTT